MTWFSSIIMGLESWKGKLFVIKQPISLASPTDSEYLCSGMRSLNPCLRNKLGVEWLTLSKISMLAKQAEGKPFGPYGH
ncbi:hypothetical protein Tco_0839513 [Tanacetum coccineum]|uniref:Uncharacterized protein n=1 Tax=Tanacetum coccineum TaxID=301880 RepID=A0ABQ5ARY3_9ASTR